MDGYSDWLKKEIKKGNLNTSYSDWLKQTKKDIIYHKENDDCLSKKVRIRQDGDYRCDYNREFDIGTVDWYKLPTNTIIEVSNNGREWVQRYFAGFTMRRGYERSVFWFDTVLYTWKYGKDSLANWESSYKECWNFARLI